MRIAPINNSGFRANLWVEKDVEDVISTNKEAFYTAKKNTTNG